MLEYDEAAGLLFDAVTFDVEDKPVQERPVARTLREVERRAEAGARYGCTPCMVLSCGLASLEQLADVDASPAGDLILVAASMVRLAALAHGLADGSAVAVSGDGLLA